MKDRISHICDALFAAPVFADIGCDHGYMALHMLKNHLCERAYISDISSGSLKKAQALLADYIAEGKCIPVVANGLEGIKEPCDLVLIAGMGGEEIVSILAKFPLPRRFVLQPMKSREKVRRFLLSRGAKIERDCTFSEEKRTVKYYDLIVGAAEGGDVYSEREFRYGRDNLNGVSPCPFLDMMRGEREKIASRLTRQEMSAPNREKLLKELSEKENIIDEIERYLQSRG